jgi:2-polyprenyl-6-methoxyphenol hydroxylase-like FAD-dependent oxidoreductase
MPQANPDTPILIVGAGPVGLALAGDLGWRGVPCTVIERGDGSVSQPKMDAVGVRTMEFCRRWGITTEVEQAGYNRDHPQDYIWVTGLAEGYELGRERNPPPRDEPYPPQSPARRERCPQNFFDPVLARFASKFPHVTIRYNTELVDLVEDAERVRCTVRSTATNQTSTEQITARHVVGTDGGNSTVREQLGITMSGSPVLTYTTNAIIAAPDFWRMHDKRPGYRFIFIGPEGTWATLVAIDGRDRYRFSFVGDANKRALDETAIRSAIHRAMGRAFHFEVISIMPWIRRELVADRFGTDRVFIAGDAAHLTSPTGGFGMNTGIQDAVDLGWKLEAVYRGWGHSRLLSTYDTERRPVAIRNVSEATGNLKRMLKPRSEPPPKAIFEPGIEGDQARKVFGDAYTAMMKREWFTIGIHLGYIYEGSPIIVSDGTPAPLDEVSTYTPTSRPGSRAPHVWLGPDRSTLDLFGRGFVLLRFDTTLDVARLRDSAEARHVPLELVDLDHDEAREVYAQPLVLVRPDGHVAWRGHRLPSDCLNLIDVVRGA